VLTAGGPDPATAADLAARPSDLVDPRWEAAFTALSDAELARVLPGLPADVVVTTTPALLAIAARLLPDSVALVHQEHRSSEFRGPTREPLDAYGPAADLVVFLAEPTRAHYLASWGEGAPDTAVVGNGLARDVRPRSALSADLVVVSARLVSQKQPDHAVRAFATVADIHPTWALRFVGDGPAASRVRRLARELGLTDRVQLVGRTRSMALQWASASIGLLTSKSEGYPLVIAEAFAAGVPFVSYDCPHGPRALITDGVDGRLVPPDDVDALAAALDGLMGDPDLLRRMGDRAYERAADFAPERLADTWSAVLADVVAAGPRPSRASRIRPVRPWVGPTPADVDGAAVE
jgi:glycosyltransferase involved in cell wall biosynthesis